MHRQEHPQSRKWIPVRNGTTVCVQRLAAKQQRQSQLCFMQVMTEFLMSFLLKLKAGDTPNNTVLPVNGRVRKAY